LSGFGTAVIDEVEVLMKFLIASKAGLYSDVSGSYRERKVLVNVIVQQTAHCA